MVGKKVPQLEEILARKMSERGIRVGVRQSPQPWAGTGRRFKADFFWEQERLIVEVDGGTWQGGRHTRGAGYERDCEKLALAVLAGYRVLKVTSRQVRGDDAVDWIGHALGLWESTAGRKLPQS